MERQGHGPALALSNLDANASINAVGGSTGTVFIIGDPLTFSLHKLPVRPIRCGRGCRRYRSRGRAVSLRQSRSVPFANNPLSPGSFSAVSANAAQVGRLVCDDPSDQLVVADPLLRGWELMESTAG